MFYFIGWFCSPSSCKIGKNMPKIIGFSERGHGFQVIAKTPHSLKKHDFLTSNRKVPLGTRQVVIHNEFLT
jgi:hypothetical protein